MLDENDLSCSLSQEDSAVSTGLSVGSLTKGVLQKTLFSPPKNQWVTNIELEYNISMDGAASYAPIKSSQAACHHCVTSPARAPLLPTLMPPATLRNSEFAIAKFAVKID